MNSAHGSAVLLSTCCNSRCGGHGAAAFGKCICFLWEGDLQEKGCVEKQYRSKGYRSQAGLWGLVVPHHIHRLVLMATAAAVFQ